MRSAPRIIHKSLVITDDLLLVEGRDPPEKLRQAVIFLGERQNCYNQITALVFTTFWRHPALYK